MYETSDIRKGLKVVMEGVRNFPRHGDLILEAARLATACGFAQEAEAIATLGERVSTDPAARDRFKVMAETLRRDAAKSVPPASP